MWVAAYFGWQSEQGAFGREARALLEKERAEQARTLADLVLERERLEERVKRLRSRELDADLLDERLRAKLNMARPGELVIMHGAASPRPEAAR